jgi:uracil-DNA glycosylase
MIIRKESWPDVLTEELNSAYFKQIVEIVNNKYETETVYPEHHNIFNCLNHFEFHETKVVILGQDPYHGKDQANGLAFSVNNNKPLPPSLKNIFKEIEHDLEVKNTSGDLTPWAKQGVLLLNSTLTVSEGSPLSHQNIGWEKFTNQLIKIISDNLHHIVFVLWGTKAIKKRALIDDKKHLVLTAPHPSPLSVYRGFYNQKHFSRINEYLKSNNKEPINWRT